MTLDTSRYAQLTAQLQQVLDRSRSGNRLLGAATRDLLLLSSSVSTSQLAVSFAKSPFVALPLDTCFQASFQSYVEFDFTSSLSAPHHASTLETRIIKWVTKHWKHFHPFVPKQTRAAWITLLRSSTSWNNYLSRCFTSSEEKTNNPWQHGASHLPVTRYVLQKQEPSSSWRSSCSLHSSEPFFD